MTEHEHDEGLAPVEWLLLIPTAALWMVNGLAGFLLFTIFVGYAIYRQNPAAFAGLLDAPAKALPSRAGRSRGQRQGRSDDDALLHALLDDDQADDAPQAQAAPALAVVPWREWRKQAVHAHHLLVIGNTGSGKTTLVRALLTGKQGAILILDPKNRPDKWGGIEAIGLDDQAEYTRIEHALRHVLHELRQRQRALNEGHEDFVPLTVVVDEAPDVAEECPTFPTVFKRVGSLGRELHISLIVLSQRRSVKALDISGDGEARDNFTKILMGGFARRAVPALDGQQHCAVLDAEGERRVLDIRPLPAYARLPIKAGVVSGVAMDSTGERTDRTEDVPGTGTNERSTPGTPQQNGAYEDVPGSVPGTYQGIPGTRTEGNTGDNRDVSDEQIRTWAREGLKRSQICDRLRGTKQKRLERLSQVLGPHDAQDRTDDHSDAQADDDDDPPPAFGWLGC
jgi:hypothetical protein